VKAFFQSLKARYALPGTVPWLVLHELRLMLRTTGSKNPALFIALVSIMWIIVHVVAVFAMFGLEAASKQGGLKWPTWLPIAAGVTFWVMFTLAFSQTMAHAVNAFFTRGDLDLLLSSPIAPRTVLAVRAMSIGFAAILLPILLIVPFAHAGLVMGRPSLMSIYPMLFAFGLLTGALGVAMSMFTVSLVGARRAKVAVQVMGAFIGAAAFLALQAQNLLGRERAASMSAWARANAEEGRIFAAESPLWWPGRAAMGEWLPAVAFVAISVAVFLIVMRMTEKRFIEGEQESGTAKRNKKVRLSTEASVFSSNIHWVILKKEWRLILRDPQVISQTLLQILYLMPVLFMGITGKFSAALLIPGVVIIVGMLASNLAWLTIAAEDAPELIAASPLGVVRARIMKGIAAAVPPLLLILPLVGYWLVTQPRFAIALMVGAAGACVGAAATQILNPQRGDRKDIAKRGKTNVIGSLLDFLSAAGWALFAFGLTGTWWACIAAIPMMIASPLYAYSFGTHNRQAAEWA
jgi:ABC-2 type transport system permease protein